MPLHSPPVVLTIAASDSGAGAGIQADLKTLMALGVYGTVAVTAITSQNTLGIKKVFPLPASIVYQQIKSIAEDIQPLAVKIGALGNVSILKKVVQSLQHFKFKNIVVDPVLRASDGSPLFSLRDLNLMIRILFPIATVLTPNLQEAEAILSEPIKNAEQMHTAVTQLRIKTKSQWIVLKGGHFKAGKKVIDAVYNGKEMNLLESPRIITKNSHGTGCTFSSAIAAGLAKGISPLEAIKQAKRYVTNALKKGISIGKGRGPLNHGFGLNSSR